MPDLDPKERFKNIPGTVGMILRGELQNICDLCGLDGNNHADPKNFSYTPLAVNDPLIAWGMNAIYQSLGKDSYQTNPNNKKLYHVTAGLCTKKYKEKLADLSGQLYICDVCGAAWDENKSRSITPIELYLPETLNEALRMLGAAEFKPRSICPIHFLTLCQPECEVKFNTAYAEVSKKSRS